MKLKFLFSLLLAALCAAPAWADNLHDIYQLARQHDPQFRASEAEYRANQEARAQGRAPLLPQVNLSAYNSDNTQDVKVGINPGKISYDSSGYTLSLSQSIYNHAFWVQLRQANAFVAQAEANFHNAEQELIVRVTQRYFDYLASLDNLVFARAEKTAIDQQLNQTRQRFNVGLIAITDVHEAQARYDQAVAQVISAENQLAIARENLREITGQPHEELATLSPDSPLLAPEPDDIRHWVETALEHSLPLIAADKAREIAEYDISRARAGHYPTLDLVAERSYLDTEGGITGPRESEDTSLSLRLRVPLYSGGLVASSTREAVARAVQSRELYEQTRRGIERQIRSAYLSVIANISQVRAFQQAVASSRTALEATQAGFEVGTRTTVDVLNSQRELYRAERDYARSRYDYVLEGFRLKQASGVLSEQDVQQISAWLK